MTWPRFPSLPFTAAIVGVGLVAGATTALAQDRPVPEWLIAGPYRADAGRAGLERDYIGREATILPSPGDTAAGLGFAAAPADSGGGLDLNHVFPGGTDWRAVYAHTYVLSPEERTVLLVMDSDDDLVALVNGQRIWLNPAARGLGSGRDTAVVRLARGWNSVLLKVRNRTGGFGLRARLAPVPGDGLAGLQFATARPAVLTQHNLPAPAVAAEPLRLRSALAWGGDVLEGRGIVGLRVWGGDTLRSIVVSLRQGSRTIADARYEYLAPGVSRPIDLSAGFAALRSAALGDAPLALDAAWSGGRSRATVPVDAESLLRLLSGRITIAGADSASLLEGSDLIASLVVPDALEGLSLDLSTRGMGERAIYSVNGQRREWRDGRVSLCEPCRAGDAVALRITAEPGRPRWLPPMARVREPGYAEYADGARYAAALTRGTMTAPRPDPVQWLRAMDDPRRAARLRDSTASLFAGLTEALKRDTLYLVGNSHIDAAWLWRWQETIDVIRNTWRTSLKLAELFPGYRFAASSAAFYDAMDRFEPTLADSLATATAAGTWFPVGGWWVEPDQNTPSGESLVRQGLYGQRYFARRFGRRSTVAWTPDTFGYPWTIPQILRQSGFDAFVTQKIRWNDSTELPYDQFWWEGLDGTRIFAYNPWGYDSDLSPERLIRERLGNEERHHGSRQVVLFGVGDHGGGPTIAMLERAEDLRRVPAFPSLVYSGPERALGAIRVEAGDRLPVWRDELYLEYHRGTFTTHAAIKQRNRESEARLQTAEALATVDTAPYPRDRLERAWRGVLFNQFHDILPGSGIDSIYRDAHATYDSAWAVIDSVAVAALARLAERLDTRGRHTAAVVFNPLGWARSGTVRVETPDGPVLVSANDVPGVGAVVVQLPGDSISDWERGLERPSAGSAWIENAYLRVEVSPMSGVVTRIYDKRAGREALASGGRANVLQVFDDRPAQWDAWNIGLGAMAEVTGVRRLFTRANARRAVVEVERAWGNSVFRQRLVLGRTTPYLEVENDIEWGERRKMLKVAFELSVSPDSATFEIPYGTIGRSGRPRTQAERAKYEVPGQRWADASTADYGVTVFNDSKYGWDYRENVLRLSLLRAPIWPDSAADRGRHRFRFAVYPHQGDWRAAGSDRLAAEYNVPLVAVHTTSHGGPLGIRFGFASAGPENVQLAWLKRAEDSGRVAARLVEWHGIATDATLAMRCDVAEAHRADLLEDAGDALAVQGREVRVPLRPYEIATVLVDCASR